MKCFSKSLIVIFIFLITCIGSSILSKSIDISWILISRNDDYCGNPMERLKTTLHHLFKKLHQYGLEQSNEVILIDWNSEIPIVNNPQIDKWLQETNYNLKVLEVPPELAQKITDSKLSEVHGLNAAARRANGHFIIRIDQDCVVGDEIFEFICKNCKEDPNLYNTVWWCTRRNTTLKQYRDFIKDPETFLAKNAEKTKSMMCKKNPTYQNLGYHVGILGVPKNIWIEHKGFNEQLVYYGTMELELFPRLKEKNASITYLNEWLRMQNPVYHIWHKNYLMQKDRKYNTHIFHLDEKNNIYKLKPNDENWGLAHFDLNIAVAH